MKQKWEYMSTTRDSDLNRLGDEGWELVAVTVAPAMGQLTFWLKRRAGIYFQGANDGGRKG